MGEPGYKVPFLWSKKIAKVRRRGQFVLGSTLVFLLLVSPISTALAQEESGVQQNEATQSTTEENGNREANTLLNLENTSEDQIQQSVESEDTADVFQGETSEDLDELARDSAEENAVESQSMLLQQGEDETSSMVSGIDAVQPSEISGSLVYGYPIVVPPGRNGMSPPLQLSYNTSVFDTDIFGHGWSLNIPRIERLNKKGTETLFDNDYYASTLDGELVKVDSTTYKARVESGDFKKYTYSGGFWTMESKDGLVYKFGSTTDARLDNPGNSSQVTIWYLEEVRDQNDNYIKYEYFKDNGQIYPETITYTGHGSTDGIFEVEFVREGRSDIATSSALGFPVVTKYRISEIRTEINGTWAHKYTLGYDTADNGIRSILTSITQSGQDNSSNVTTLPAETYNYSTSTHSWLVASSWNYPSFIVFDGKDQGVRFLDVNGDGLVDFVRSNTGTTTIQKAYLNVGDSWVEDSNWTIPEVFANDGTDLGVRFGDVNGDELVDIIRSYTDGSDTLKVYLNTGTGWTYNASWTIPEYASISGFNPGVQFLDLNGDGLTDLIKSSNTGTVYKKAYLNDGDSWEYDSSWSIPEVFVDSDGDTGVRLVDINGDGLPDMVRAEDDGVTETNKVYLNNGSGWSEEVTWTVPEFIVVEEKGQGVQFADVNGDGLADLVKSFKSGATTTQKIYVNDGASWQLDGGWTIPSAFVFSDQGDDLGTTLIDLNGDNVVDWYRSHSSSSTEVKASYEGDGERSDLLNEIGYPKGGSTLIEYTQTTQLRSGGVLLNPNLPRILDVIASITHDSLVNTFSYVYEYGGAKINYVGPFDRRFAGFATTTVTNDFGHKQITNYHQGDGSNSSLGEYSDNAWKVGMPYRTEWRDDFDALFSRTVNRWEDSDLGDGSHYVKLARSTEFTYDGDGDHKDKATSYTYDTNGNATQIDNWGVVTASGDGSFTDAGSDKRTMVITYASSTSPYLVGQATKIVYDNSSNKSSEEHFYYDEQSLNSITIGNLSKHESWATSSTYIDNEYSYNLYGLVTQEKDPRDKITTYTYDLYNLYPATSTNPFSQSIYRTFDYSSGEPEREVSPNGYVFETVYDGLDRVVENKQPDVSSPSTLVTNASYQYTDTGTTSVQTRTYLDTSLYFDKYTYYDGLGRIIQEKTETENSDEYITNDVVYNAIGKESSLSLPYFTDSISVSSPTTASYLLVTQQYDALGRLTERHDVTGTTTYTFDDWKTTVTDAEGNSKHLYNDAVGLLVQVDEENDAETYTTAYQYNANGNLTKLTDALGNVRNFTYDALGRRTSAEDLHDPTDTTFGIWSYSYDAAGNITTTIDAKGQTINYTFDDINRILTEDWTGSSSVEAEYAYDDCLNGIGMVCTATSTNTTQDYFGDPKTVSLSEFEYDPLGRIEKEVKYVDKVAGQYIGTYTTELAYNRQGSLTFVTYPDNSEVRYTYNDGGLLEKIEQKESDGDYRTIVTDYDYNPNGDVIYRENGNTTYTTYTYDPTELYRLRNVKTEKPGMGGNPEEIYILDDNYEFDLQSMLLAQIDGPIQLTSLPARSSKTKKSPSLYKTETSQERGSDYADFNLELKEAYGEDGRKTISVSQQRTQKEQEEYEAFMQTLKRENAKRNEVPTTRREGFVQGEKKPFATRTVDDVEEQEVVEEIDKPESRTSIDEESEPKEEQEEAPEQVVEEESAEIDSATSTSTTTDEAPTIQEFEPATSTGSELEDVELETSTTSQVVAWFKNLLSGIKRGLAYLGQKFASLFGGLTAWAAEGNIVDNPSFETTPTEYYFYGTASSTATHDCTDSTDGSCSYEIDNATAGDDWETRVVQIITIEPNVTYSLSFDAKKDNATTSTFNISVGMEHAPYADYGLWEQITPTTTWQSYEFEFESEATTTDPLSSIFFGFGDYVNTYHIDNIVLEEVDTSTTTEIIENKSFETNTDGWEWWATYDDGMGRSCGDASDGSCAFKVELSQAAANNYEAQLNYVNFEVVSGETYYLSFDAKASSTRDVTAVLGQDHSPWSSLSNDDTVEISTSWDTYTMEFDATGSDSDSRLSIMFGSDPTGFFIDNISLTYGTTSTSTSSGNDPLTNGGFESGTSPWQFWATYDDGLGQNCGDSSEGSCSFMVELSQAAPNNYQAQLNYPDLVFATSAAYTIIFDAKASSTRDVSVLLSQDHSPWSLLSQIAVFELSTEWETYAVTATTSATETDGKLSFEFGDDATGFRIDNVRFYDGNPPTEPSALQTEGSTNPTDITDNTPEFSAVYEDADDSDVAIYYQIQVATTTSFTSTVWDSSKTAMASTTEGNRSPEITYAGTALASSTTYYWRMKFWDTEGIEGDWSTTTASFALESTGSTTSIRIFPTGCDGYVGHSASTWSSAHDADTGGVAVCLFSDTALVGVGRSSNQFDIARGFIAFDTSVIPDTATITAATLNVYVTAKSNDDNDGDDYITVVQTSQPNINSLSSFDYDTAGSTTNPVEGIEIGERKDITDITTGQHLSFALNATGTTWINTGESGRTKLGMREGHDTTNSSFTGSNGQANQITFGISWASGTTTDPYLEVTYLTDETEITEFIPTELETEEMTNPVNIVDATPEFTAINNHPTGEDAADYQIQVSTSSTDWTNLIWDSGREDFPVSIDDGNRTTPVSYTGPELATSTTYYWRMKFWSFPGDEEGEWSTETASFRVSSGGVSIGLIEDRTYTYDAVGNITQIIDMSDTDSAATTTYAYDDLYRLTFVSTSNASSTPFTHTYEYDAIGNIASSSDLGTYYYTGATSTDDGTKWANPNAVTGVTPAGSAEIGELTYDKNGNLLTSNVFSESLVHDYTWDYNNRLLLARKPVFYEGGIATYAYTEASYFDHNGERVILRTDFDTVWYYPNKYYKFEYNTVPYTPIQATKNVYAGDDVVATIVGTSSDAKIYTNHLDYLGGTRAVTEFDGDTTQVLDYYPYGSPRIRNQYTPFDQKKKFTGHEYDDETDVYFMGARYYEPNIKRFLSQDPIFWGDITKLLTDPQQLNSYSYARNNPLSYIDPNGELVLLVARKLDGFDSEFGLHLFFHVIPFTGSLRNEDSYQGEEFTLSAFFSGNTIMGKTVKEKNRDLGVDFVQRVMITPPNGMSEKDFVSNLLSAFDSMPDDKGYNFLSIIFGNSNNFAYELGSRVGVGDQVEAFVNLLETWFVRGYFFPAHTVPGGTQGYRGPSAENPASRASGGGGGSWGGGSINVASTNKSSSGSGGSSRNGSRLSVQRQKEITRSILRNAVQKYYASGGK